MIPVLTTMVALLTIAVCSFIISREQDRMGGGTFASVMALLAIIGAIIGGGYVWHLSLQAGQQMERAQQEIERLQWP